MITLHRLGTSALPVRLNCDLILTIEATPDTVISLVTGARLIVTESPDEVVAAVRDWRAEVARHTFGVPRVLEPEVHDFTPQT
ncbi:MAG: flagellar FlbD family protein [Solirubrobacteraceae bacterium]|nr:flagellar FlbD family protein [Solirubrobacteraceae bacterium]